MGQETHATPATLDGFGRLTAGKLGVFGKSPALQ